MTGDRTLAESLTDALTRPAEIKRLSLHTEEGPVLALDGRVAWLASLEELHLGTNRSDIQRVDGLEALLQLRNLRIFGLSLDGLPEIPAPVFALRGLTELSVRANGMRALPDALGNLSTLKRLDLSLWHLDALPAGIAGLVNLVDLSLRGCQLRRLPDELGALSSLETLYAESNLLESLPASLAALPKLRRLLLGSNHLRVVPASLAALPSLEWLDLMRNPDLETLPVALAERAGLRLEVEPEKLPAAARAGVVDASATALATLEALARAKERPAWTFVVTPGEGGPTESKIGGVPWLAPQEPWPRCGLCEAPMEFWLQVDYGAPHGRTEHSLLQLFSCEAQPSVARLAALVAADDPRMSEAYRTSLRELFAKLSQPEVTRLAESARNGGSWEPHQKLFESRGLTNTEWWNLVYDCHVFAHYICGADRLVRVVDAPPGVDSLSAHAQRAAAPAGPTPRRIVQLVERVDRPTLWDVGDGAWKSYEKLTPAARETERKWTLSCDKLGGWPRWLQDRSWLPCPECGEPTTELVLALEGADDDLFQALESSILYVTRCTAHPRALVWSPQSG